jgi:hypothetical protein
MATSLFRSAAPLYPEGSKTGAPAASSSSPVSLPRRRETLAIVSTSSRLCGIAAYTAALQRQLADAFDITVFNLDQYLMRNLHRRVRKLADRRIKEICRELRRFDVVNLQLEHGTLGRYGSDIYRRFCWLADAAPRLSVTFHTLPMPPGDQPGGAGEGVADLQCAGSGAAATRIPPRASVVPRHRPSPAPPARPQARHRDRP